VIYGDLPASLGEALRALEADHEFLLRDGGFFDDGLLTDWVDNNQLHPYEVHYRTLFLKARIFITNGANFPNLTNDFSRL
jgi:hypothetical protein